MTEELDSLASLEKKLNIFGYELFDLGEDFGSLEHVYYVFPPESGIPVAGCFFRIEEVGQLAKRLEMSLDF